MVATRNKWLNKRSILGLSLIVIIVVGFATYRFYQSRHRQHQTVIPSTSQAQNVTSNSSSDSGKQPSGATGSADTTSSQSASSSSSNSTVKPQAPFGSFVSNHKPGGANPTQEQSVCNTTAGASCYIQFTKDDVIKRLNAQVTDGNGSTMWNWDVKNAGLSAGSWQITAIASLNGQTSSTQDQIKLEVSP